VAGALSSWPLVARAQQPAMPVVGYLGAENPERFGIRLTAFRQGLSEMGYDDGSNVKIEFRWANGQNDRLPALADELVRRQVTGIAAPGSGVAALAAKGATTTIPIVFETGVDPVTAGLVKSLSRPEGNVTGITSLNTDVTPKGLELLRELIPQSKSFAVLVNPTNRVNLDIVMKGVEGASRNLYGAHPEGEKPVDLPVQQATKIELTINLKTAKALGLNVPNTLIGRVTK
jgi:putative ABC transport system substrate-binding protein